MIPLVSILIPCHNAAPWVAATLESALATTWSRREIVLVDDGSQDTSLFIARTFESRGVIVATQPNSGASAARNHALRLARGDFIQFLDADDLLAPDKIALQLQALSSDPVQTIAAGPWGRFDTDPDSAVFTPEENWRDSEPVDWLCHNFAGRGMMPPAAWLTPRGLLDDVGPWDERLTLNDDGEYFCRVLLRSRGIKFCPAARTYYRSNLAGSLSRRRTPAAWQSAFLSQQLCVEQLLAHETSARTRQAGADLYQRLAYSMFPNCPDLVQACEARALALGGSAERLGGGALFRFLSKILGWKVARRVQLAAQSQRA